MRIDDSGENADGGNGLFVGEFDLGELWTQNGAKWVIAYFCSAGYVLENIRYSRVSALFWNIWNLEQIGEKKLLKNLKSKTEKKYFN